MTHSFRTNLEVLLDKLNLLSNNLKKQESVSQIDIDLMIRYTQKVYELLLEEQKGNMIVDNNLNINVKEKRVEEKQNFKSETPTKIKEIKNPAKQAASNEKTETKKKPMQVMSKTKPQKNFVSEEAEDDFNSLNKKFSKDSVMLADQLKEKPIKDLNKGIDLNDKYWFINDLFNGKPGIFNEHLKTLNKMNNLEEALLFIEKEIRTQFDWKGKERSSKKFLSFIYRRFA